jgi:hypothetical protein
MLKTYLITEIVRTANSIPTWLGWTIVGVLGVATLAVLTAIVVEIIINR